jgi:hypothetical protein
MNIDELILDQIHVIAYYHPEWAVYNRPDLLFKHRKHLVFEYYPEWVADNDIDWLMEHHPKWVYTNRKDLFDSYKNKEIPENILKSICLSQGVEQEKESSNTKGEA